jgi:beta-galactosidase
VLGLRPLGTVTGSHTFYPSITAHGWAAPRPETRTSFAELYASDGDVVLREVSTGQGCGFEVPVGSGRAVVLATDYECDLSLWRAAVGFAPGLSHTAAIPGVVLLTTVADSGGRLLHALNVSGYDQSLTITEHGQPLLGGATLRLPGRRALMLPLDLRLGGLQIAYATAEAVAVSSESVTFRAPAGEAVVAVAGPATCAEAEVSRVDGLTVLRVRAPEFTVHA